MEQEEDNFFSSCALSDTGNRETSITSKARHRSRPQQGHGHCRVILLAGSQAHLLKGSLIKKQGNYLMTEGGICLDQNLDHRKEQNVYKQQLHEKDAQGMNIKTATRADEETLLNVIESADLDQAIKLLEGHLFSQDGLDRALISACQHGLKYLVQTLVRLGANINFKDTQGNTPLLICAKNGFVEIVYLLLNRQADVNVLNSAGDSALILAIRASGSSEMVRVFLAQEGTDINHQNLDGYTALMKAVEARDVDVIKILMEGYAYRHLCTPSCESMKAISSKGLTAEEMADKCGLGNIYNILETYVISSCVITDDWSRPLPPLLAVIEKCDIESLNNLLDCQFIGEDDICAAFQQIFQKCDLKEVKTFTNNEIVMIRSLLECGADITISWNDCSSPLSVAVKTGDYNLVELMCQHLDEQQKITSQFGTQALREAAKTGRCDLLELLLKYKADINGYDYPGSPLDCALSNGLLESAKLLVQHGAQMNVKSALQSAVTLQVPEYMNFILNFYKPKVVTYVMEDFGSFSNLLVSASKGGNLEIIGYLLDAGADVNFENASRESPLTASKNGEVARFLITRRANVNHLMSYRDTPLLNILKNRHKYVSSNIEVVKVLIENGASVNVRRRGRRPLMIAASKEGSGAMLQTLLDHGANFNHQDDKGNTALITAALGGCSQNVSFLLQKISLSKEKNHCLNVQNHKGLTALMCAVPHKNHKIVKELLDFNADVNIKDKRGYTALLLAVKKTCGSGETMTALIRAGSDVNCQNNNGYSPLMLAAKKSWKEAILILLDSGAEVNAVSKKYTTKTALTFLSPNIPFGKDIISCLQALISRGASSSYTNPGFLNKIILNSEFSVIPELMLRGLGPADAKRQGFYMQLDNISPLCMALLVENISLARFFVGNLFLTSSDVTSMARCQKLRYYIGIVRLEKSLDFLDEMSSQPLSLYQLTFVTVLSAVGTSPGRENRVNLLPLPQVIKDKLLFKSVELQLNIPRNYIQFTQERIISDTSDSDDSNNNSCCEFADDDYMDDSSDSDSDFT